MYQTEFRTQDSEVRINTAYKPSPIVDEIGFETSLETLSLYRWCILSSEYFLFVLI